MCREFCTVVCVIFACVVSVWCTSSVPPATQITDGNSSTVAPTASTNFTSVTEAPNSTIASTPVSNATSQTITDASTASITSSSLSSAATAEITSSIIPQETTTAAAATTLSTPVPCSPGSNGGFSPGSFIGGIVLGVGVMIIVYIAYRYYVSRKGTTPYHQF